MLTSPEKKIKNAHTSITYLANTQAQIDSQHNFFFLFIDHKGKMEEEKDFNSRVGGGMS